MSWRIDPEWRERLARYEPLRFGSRPGPVLGPRLAALAHAVPAGAKRVADVGADHGLLGAALLAVGHVEHVVAIDRSPLALAGAAGALARWVDLGRATLLVADGLAPAVAVDAAVIAGIGGPTTAGIIDRAAGAGAVPSRLIVQPLTGHHLVRLALARAGYRTLDERLDLDGDRVVATFTADFVGAPEPEPAGDALFIGHILEERAQRTERDRAHLDGWFEGQRRWLEERGGAALRSGAPSDPRVLAIAAALARRGTP